MRFLIADDHELVRRGMRSIVESRGNVDVSEAQNGIEAVERTKREKFDLVILDVSMPGRSGLDVLRDLKVLRPKLPILVLSMHHASPQETPHRR